MAMAKLEDHKASMKKLILTLTEVQAERDYLFDAVKKNPNLAPSALKYLEQPENGE